MPGNHYGTVGPRDHQRRTLDTLFTEEVRGVIIGDGEPEHHQYTFHDTRTGRCIVGPQQFPHDDAALAYWRERRPVDWRERYPDGVDMRCWDKSASPSQWQPEGDL